MHFMHNVHLSSYYLFNLLSLGIIYIQWGQRPLAHFCNSTGQLYWNCCEFLGRLVIKKKHVWPGSQVVRSDFPVVVEVLLKRMTRRVVPSLTMASSALSLTPG